MTSIRRFIISLVFVSVGLITVASIGCLIVRETLLWQADQAFKDDLHALRKMKSPTTCQKEFGQNVAQDNTVIRQLRFTDSRKYVIELLCPGFPDRPLAQEQRTLGRYVSKLSGAAGIIVYPKVSESLIGIVVFQELVHSLPPALQSWLSWISRGELIGLVQGDVTSRPLPKSAITSSASQFGIGPVSSCEGYGYSCCDVQTELGMGDSVRDLPSCPTSCFARCLSRPLVASWRSNPMPDWESNVLELPSGGTAEFSYVVADASEASPWTATISFGDGEMMIAKGKDGTVTHSYTCSTGLCDFTATVTVENKNGAQSAKTPLTTLKVAVTAPSN